MEENKRISTFNKRETDTFSILYNRYWGKVYNFTRLYLNSTQEVEEVVQEVFIKLWEIREKLTTIENFNGYLFILTRNFIFNRHRKSFNEDFYRTSVLSAVEEASYNMEEEIEANNLREYISLLIQNLPDRQREVFILSREKQLSYKEIAQQLNISEKTVERHINEALKYLRKNIRLLTIFLVGV